MRPGRSSTGRILLRGLMTALCLLLAGAGPSPAQTVQGRLLSADDGSPITGAYVVIEPRDGRPADETLTGDDGAFTLEAPSAGRYRIRAERIGFRTWTSDVFRLDDGERRSSTFRVTVEPVRLEGLRVEAERRCELDGKEARAAGRLLEEARKALRVLEWGRSETRFSFDTREYSRFVEEGSGVVRDSRTTRRTGVTGRPFVSLSPDTLTEAGFVEAGADSLRYYGPDIRALLSRQFVETHCFRVRRGGAQDEAERIGLAFDPAPGRSQPDIAGTLWLDAESAKLQEMDFSYTNLPSHVPAGMAGGHVSFRELDTGDWIVERWRIEVPEMVRRRIVVEALGVRRTELSLAGMREGGGRVTEVRSEVAGGRDRSNEDEGGATVSGFVYDSLRGEWLSGARVYVPGGPSTRTGAQGRFTLRGVPPERVEIHFGSPRLRALDVEPEHETLLARSGGSYRVQLATPGPEAVRRRLCGADSAAVVAGRIEVGPPGNERPRASAEMELRAWHPGPSAEAGSRLRSWSTVADSAGVFRLCGVPLATGRLVGRLATDGSDPREVRLPLGDGMVQWIPVLLSPEGKD